MRTAFLAIAVFCACVFSTQSFAQSSTYFCFVPVPDTKTVYVSTPFDVPDNQVDNAKAEFARYAAKTYGIPIDTALQQTGCGSENYRNETMTPGNYAGFSFSDVTWSYTPSNSVAQNNTGQEPNKKYKNHPEWVVNCLKVSMGNDPSGATEYTFTNQCSFQVVYSFCTPDNQILTEIDKDYFCHLTGLKYRNLARHSSYIDAGQSSPAGLILRGRQRKYSLWTMQCRNENDGSPMPVVLGHNRGLCMGY